MALWAGVLWVLGAGVGERKRDAVPARDNERSYQPRSGDNSTCTRVAARFGRPFRLDRLHRSRGLGLHDAAAEAGSASAKVGGDVCSPGDCSGCLSHRGGVCSERARLSAGNASQAAVRLFIRRVHLSFERLGIGLQAQRSLRTASANTSSPHRLGGITSEELAVRTAVFRGPGVCEVFSRL